jgi:hypothetical protein
MWLETSRQTQLVLLAEDKLYESMQLLEDELAMG